MTLKLASLRQLLFWMEERQQIYLKRQRNEPWPWTKDLILQRYRFCNTYREQDKETVWLRTNWREPYAEHPNLWFACAMFRVINWSPTLAEIGFPHKWEPKRVMRVMEARRIRGEKVYTSAYMLPSHGCVTKPEYTVMKVLDPLWRDVLKNGQPRFTTLQLAHEWLTQFYGFGAFLAYETVTDWRHTRYLREAEDIDIWANPGPGARRGVCRLLHVPLNTNIGKEELLAYMNAIYTWVEECRDREILPTLEMRDIEHSLCEYDKYVRAKERLRADATVGLERFVQPLVTLVQP